MKKIILILAAVIMVMFTACNSTSTPENTDDSSWITAQTDVISSFGISQKQNRIVAYRNENAFLEYVVAMYDGDRKISEKTYYFYVSGYEYEYFKEENAENETMTFVDEGFYVIKDTSLGNTGTYDGDYMNIGKNYDFR